MIGEPLDVDRLTQAVRQNERKPTKATMSIRRPASTNESRWRDDPIASIRVELTDGLFLNDRHHSTSISPERGRVRWPNDKAWLPAGLSELSTWKGLVAPPVSCSTWFGGRIPTWAF